MTLTEKVYKHIDRLEKENKRLEKYIENLQVVHFTELQTEKAENARLKKKMERLMDFNAINLNKGIKSNREWFDAQSVLVEKNARLRKHIRKAIVHFLKVLEDDPNERGKDHQD